MTPEEKKIILIKGEKLYKAGDAFVIKLVEWVEMIKGIEDALITFHEDPDFDVLNKKLESLNNQLKDFM